MSDATEVQMHGTTFAHDLTAQQAAAQHLRRDAASLPAAGEANALVHVGGLDLEASRFSDLTFLVPRATFQAMRSDVGLSPPRAASRSLWRCPLGRYMPSANPLLGFFASCHYPEDAPAADDCCELDESAGLCARGYVGTSDDETRATCSGACPIGHYCPQGTVAPVACPAGRHFPAVGAGDGSSCIPCEPGQARGARAHAHGTSCLHALHSARATPGLPSSAVLGGAGQRQRLVRRLPRGALLRGDGPLRVHRLPHRRLLRRPGRSAAHHLHAVSARPLRRRNLRDRRAHHRRADHRRADDRRTHHRRADHRRTHHRRADHRRADHRRADHSHANHHHTHNGDDED
jgi:hypothetical protein